jgi:hypothetical protein
LFVYGHGFNLPGSASELPFLGFVRSIEMKILTRSCLVAVGVLLATSSVFAQRGQGRGGNRNNEVALLGRADVQKDLGLTTEQVSKLDAMREGAAAKRGQGGNGGSGGNGGGQRRQGAGSQPTEEERAKMATQAKERREKSRKELLTVITEAQLTRLDEIMVQLQGNQIILNAEMQTKLGMTAEQKEKASMLQTKLREATQGLYQKVQAGEMAQEDVQAAMKRNNEAMKVELGKILTAAQTEALKKMGGKTFVADEA